MSNSETDKQLSAAEQSLRTADLGHDIVVLPEEFSEENVALYDDSIIDLVKLLRTEGVDAVFAHDAESRSWIGKKSAEILIAFIVGIASNAGWAAITALLQHRYNRRNVQAKVAHITQTEGKTSWEWLEFTGTGEEVARLLDSYERKRIE